MLTASPSLPPRSLGHAPSVTTSDLSTHSTTSLISNEEQFEDYGEGDDVDCAPSSPCPDDETRTNVYSDLGSSVSSRWPRGLEWQCGVRDKWQSQPDLIPGRVGGQSPEPHGCCSWSSGVLPLHPDRESRIPPASSWLGEETDLTHLGGCRLWGVCSLAP